MYMHLDLVRRCRLPLGALMTPRPFQHFVRPTTRPRCVSWARRGASMQTTRQLCRSMHVYYRAERQSYLMLGRVFFEDVDLL